MKVDWLKLAPWLVSLVCWAVIAAASFVACRHFQRPAPKLTVTAEAQPVAPAKAVAKPAVTVATATQSIRVTIRRQPTASRPRTAAARPNVGKVAEAPQPSPLTKGTSVPATPEDAPQSPVAEDEVIVVELEQAAVATASAPQAAEAVEPEYSRLGAMVGTFPGVAAFTFQAVRVPVPATVVGVKVDIGIDIEANLDQAGVALTVGRKAFIAAGGHVTHPRAAAAATLGWHVGVGLRF